MDGVDREILEVLRGNSRAPYKEIADRVRISDVAVHKRIKKLRDVIRRFTVLVDQKEWGKEVTALLSLRCASGRMGEIAAELARIEDVTEVYTTVGDQDIIAKVRTKDMETLREIVEKRMGKIRGLLEVRTSIVFGCIKEELFLVM
jgi:Lrp/AsnC family transcriptional regulator for asnA, asnC and gidA